MGTAAERAGELSEAALSGDRRALARLLTAVENRTPLAEAFETAKHFDVEYLPVVSSSNEDKSVGVLDCREVRRQLSAEVLSRQEEADNIQSVQCI